MLLSVTLLRTEESGTKLSLCDQMEDVLATVEAQEERVSFAQ